jgi:hypothetical protein
MAFPLKQFDATESVSSVATTELVGDFTVRDGDKGEITCLTPQSFEDISHHHVLFPVARPRDHVKTMVKYTR